MTTALNPPVPAEPRVEHPIRSTREPAIAATSTPNEPPTDQAPEVPVPVDQAGIDVLRTEIDDIDAQLVQLILRRTAVSHAIGAARRSLGGPRIVYSREMAVLQRFRELGPAGTDLGMLLLAMGRGKLGRK
jgi:chorismate mutase